MFSGSVANAPGGVEVAEAAFDSVKFDGSGGAADAVTVAREAMSSQHVPFTSGGAVFYLNFTCDPPSTEEETVHRYADCTVLGDFCAHYVLENKETNLLAEMGVLALGGAILSDGAIVAERAQETEIQDFYTYCIDYGFMTDGAHDRIIWVNSTTDLDEVREALAKDGRPVVCYQDRPGARSFFAESGVETYDIGNDASVGDWFNNKCFSNWFWQRRLDTGFEGLPSAALMCGLNGRSDVGDLPILRDTRRTDFDAVVNYAESYEHPVVDGNEQKFMFFRAAVCGGGFGNQIVYKDLATDALYIKKDGKREREWANPDELWEHITQSGKVKVDAVLTPFVQLNENRTYSFGFDVTDEAISISGPRNQLIDETTSSFEAWQIDIDSTPDEYAHFDKVTQSMIKLLIEMHKRNFRGKGAGDLFEYVQNDGSVDVELAEINVRRESVSRLLEPMTRWPKWLGSLLTGKFAGRQFDHLHIPLECFDSEPITTSKLVSILEAAGVPMAKTTEDPEGVVIMRPPFKDSSPDFADQAQLIVAFVAQSDERRDELQQLFKAALGIANHPEA